MRSPAAPRAGPRPLVLAAAAVVFVGGHVAAAVAGGEWWGLHHLRYLGVPGIAAAVVAGVAAAAAIRSGRPRFSPLLGGAVALPVFWLLRDRGHWLGDGSVLLDGAGGPLAFHEREPLAALLVQRILNAAPALGLEPAAGAELASCLLGAGLVFLLLRLDGALRGDGVVFALAALTGAVQLFFGYVETYPPVALAVVGFLVAARSPATGASSLLPATLLFLLALALHISAILLAPALGLLLVQQARFRPTPAARLRICAETAGALAIGWVVWTLAFLGVEDAQTLPEYLSILGESGYYSYAGFAERNPGVAPPLWSAAHLLEWVQLQLLLVPVALPLAGLAVMRRPRGVFRDGWTGLLAITAGAYLVAQFQFFSHLGAPRDWDVLAAGAFPIALLAGVAAAPARRTGALLAALAAFHTVPWILVNAIPTAAQARFEEMPMPGGQTQFVLGVRAMKRGDWDEAVTRLRRAVDDVPHSTTSWHALGSALERADRPDEARDAYTRALAAWDADPRADRGELLERLGLLQWRTGRRDAARATLESALAERPGSVAARVLLSYAALDEDRPARVLELLEPILNRRGENPTILVLRARALGRLGHGDEATAALDEAARRFPGDASVEAARRELAGEATPR